MLERRVYLQITVFISILFSQAEWEPKEQLDRLGMYLMKSNGSWRWDLDLLDQVDYQGQADGQETWVQ